MKTLNLNEMALVSGGNDEPISLFVRNDEPTSLFVRDDEPTSLFVRNENDTNTEVDEFTSKFGFSLSFLSFGCC